MMIFTQENALGGSLMLSGMCGWCDRNTCVRVCACDERSAISVYSFDPRESVPLLVHE